MSKRFRWGLLAAFLLGALLARQADPWGQPQDTRAGQSASQVESSSTNTDANRFPATVASVVDGDTLKIHFDGGEETVRLLLIDTPETVHPSRPVEPFGPEASAFVKELLPPGTPVEVELDVSERDKYGRLLAYIYVNGESVQELLLAQGLARVAYVYVPNVKYVDQYRAIEAEAKAAGLGIWSLETGAGDDAAPTPTPPPPPDGAVAGARPTGLSCPPEAPIKGNQSSSGEWIYHQPGGQFYDQTRPEACFSTATEAEAAGYRAAKR